MFAVQRSTQLALRRIAKPSLIQQLAAKHAAPLALTSQLQTRQVATQKLTPKDSYEILVAQRRNRPTSPHLAIYRPQITWYSSALNRITGAVLSGGFYVFGFAYLVGPLVGLNFTGASMAAAFAAWPLALKVAAKTAVAWPFVFHGFNSLRHLVWDTGKTMTNKMVIRTGWAAAAASVVSTVYLVGFL